MDYLDQERRLYFRAEDEDLFEKEGWESELCKREREKENKKRWQRLDENGHERRGDSGGGSER